MVRIAANYCIRPRQQLPFLFKVLSVRNALSIQAHPNKALAALLHEANPTEYRDDNHKPEMTIAITPFEGLSGFRPLSEIAYFLGHISALRSLVGKAVAAELEQVSVRIEASLDEQRLALKNTFTVLVRASVGDVRAASERLLEQISEEGQLFAGGFRTPGPGGEALGGLVVRLNSQFPADVGLFMVFFLNFVELQPGEAMFLKADEIHAYISGGNILLYQSCVVGPEANSMPDIVECMASSDNVVRAGLTQKYKVRRERSSATPKQMDERTNS
jgi:mannose-6-phosphate isomerase